MTGRFICTRCMRWFPADALEFDGRHRIIYQNGPDEFHVVMSEADWVKQQQSVEEQQLPEGPR